MHKVNNISSQRKVVNLLIQLCNLAGKLPCDEIEYRHLDGGTSEEGLSCPGLINQELLILLL